MSLIEVLDILNIFIFIKCYLHNSNGGVPFIKYKKYILYKNIGGNNINMENK